MCAIHDIECHARSNLNVDGGSALQVPDKKNGLDSKGHGPGDPIQTWWQPWQLVKVQQLKDDGKQKEAKHGHVLGVVSALKVPVLVQGRVELAAHANDDENDGNEQVPRPASKLMVSVVDVVGVGGGSDTQGSLSSLGHKVAAQQVNAPKDAENEKGRAGQDVANQAAHLETKKTTKATSQK